jgi:hypothetical protein
MSDHPDASGPAAHPGPPDSPAHLAVSPDQLADTSRSLSALTAAVAAVEPHFRGPQQPPALGDPACMSAYAAAHQQLGGLVHAASRQARQLAESLSAAAALYAALDGVPAGSGAVR